MCDQNYFVCLFKYVILIRTMKLVVTKPYENLWDTRIKYGNIMVNIFMCTGYYDSY